MHDLYDSFGKAIGASALDPCGETEVEAVLAPDARRADLRHDPDPAKDAERQRLGLLGRIAAVACLIELYSGAPASDDAIACLAKLITFRQQRRREAERAREDERERWEQENPAEPPPPGKPFVSPMCWIIAARRPAAALARFGSAPADGWPPGVFFGTGALFGGEGDLRVGIVDAAALPRDRSTLLVRLMAAGPLLAEALADLADLEEGAHERVVAEQIVLNLQQVLGSKPNPTPEEQEIVVTMQYNWLNGRQVGRTEEAARAVLAAFRVRGMFVPDAVRERVLAEKDPEQLERWYERAILAASVEEVFVDESRAA